MFFTLLVRQVVTHGVEDPNTFGVLESQHNIHRPLFLYVLLFQQKIVFPVTWRRNCKSRTLNAERSLFVIDYYTLSVLKKFQVKLRSLAVSVSGVCPHGTTPLPLDGFSGNLVFEYFSKICWENSSFIKIGQEWRVLYMNINVHFQCSS